MADQLRWWKLWCSVLDDGRLSDLSMEDCWRWAVLGVLLRQDGEGGAKTWPRPGRALAKAWRTTWPRLPEIARRLPGVTVEATPDSLTLTMRNWHKYQEDSSAERTRKWREKRKSGDGQQAVTRDGQPASRETEQTRRDETRPPTPVASPSQIGPNGRPPRAPYPLGLFHPFGACTRDPKTGNRWPAGTCVDRAWLAAHPEVLEARAYPAMPDPDRPDADPMLESSYVPKSCESHRR